MKSRPKTLRQDVETYLERSGMTATAFGVAAMSDPRFVFDLRADRECRSKTEERARQWMKSHPVRKRA
jgi:2,4-dienoyl-CoA reductase-like NADH-dependent reductase (Old Yellow Enzyme family)